MKRKGLVTILAAILAFTAAIPAAANQPVQVFVNGQTLQFDVPPTVVSGRTLVPLRAIFEALGAKVAWDQATRSVSATWAGGSLSLPVGSPKATVKGTQRDLDVPARIISGRTMVPLRFVAEAMGAQVGWYEKSRAVTINIPPKPLVQATVTRVVDGDTVEVTLASGNTEKIRMIGVDTPETAHPTKGEEPYGREASNFTKFRLAGQNVLLETDVEERDKYGRLLAYLYLPGGAMFNAVLVDEGYAQTATFPPNVRYVEVFRALQTSAREGNRGLWGLPVNQAPSVPPPTNRPPSAGPGGSNCDPAYPDVCIPPAPPDLDCKDVSYRRFRVLPPDPHRFDSDGDGIGCEQ